VLRELAGRSASAESESHVVDSACVCASLLPAEWSETANACPNIKV